ncbi:MAG TPA: 3-hydroxyacyl-CoA dehydrogenase family protein [Micromonosporaceae bacterium]|nr:3-hydroxyacyl-CoA dehydrogenase family protein [Micromonosporaceae bacterium]
MSEINDVGVVGAGVIGTGVAQALAQAGFGVILVDRTDDVLAAAEKRIGEGIRMHRLLSKGGSDEDRAQVLKRISYSLDLSDLAKADFVVENVTEDWPTKKAVYERMDSVCRPETIFAANTSVIPITRIAAATRRPERVLGMHFMNPVPLKPMVEVVRGYYTSEATVEAGRDLLGRMKKEAVVVGDSPGFVTNRVLMLTVNEAAFLVHEGVAGAAEIDRIFKGCFEHRMGPLETADLIGLDTVLRSIEGLYESFGDSKYRPCPLLRQLVDAGRHGRKTGHGFYSYAPER